MKKKDIRNVVYSTDPNFKFEYENLEEDTLPSEQQKLKVVLDTKQRAGKKVTLIQNFIGTKDDLEVLSKKIKTKLGIGGAVKEQEIILQGDYVAKVKLLLNEMGFSNK
jgi:translation initiation factor 1